MTSVEENVKALRSLEGWAIIAGMTPGLIAGPVVFKTDYLMSVTAFGTALALKKIGLL